MDIGAKLDCAYAPSEDIAARTIEGELVIVPLAEGIGDLQDELFTLNITGKAIWDRLNGKKTLREVLRELLSAFEAPEGEIERDLIGLVTELLRRRFLVEVV